MNRGNEHLHRDDETLELTVYPSSALSILLFLIFFAQCIRK